MSDLISRSALLEEIKSLTVKVMGLRAGKGVLNEYAKQYRDTILRIIDEQPTIEAAPVVYGEWENGCCTNCVQVDFSKPNFCSNCGADMRKGNAEWK